MTGWVAMFRGSADATIDDKGRLKIPTKFREGLLATFGPRLFVTSYGPPSMRIYPLEEWKKWEDVLVRSGWGNDSRVIRFMQTVDYFGDEQEVDGQGRILVSPRLRRHATISGEVVVLGHPTNMLEVWNGQLFSEMLVREPLTEEVIHFVTNIVREAHYGRGIPPYPGDDTGGGRTPPD